MKARNIASKMNSEALTRLSPVLRSASVASALAALTAPLAAIMSANPSSVMKVDHTRPGWIGDKYGR